MGGLARRAGVRDEARGDARRSAGVRLGGEAREVGRSQVAAIDKRAATAARREFVITDELYAKILEYFPDRPFQNLLALAWEFGARPQELLALDPTRGLGADRREIA